MKSTNMMPHCRLTLSVCLLLLVSIFTGCDRQPQEAQANVKQDRKALEIQVQSDQVSDMPAKTDFTPSPRQENEFVELVAPVREPVQVVLSCPKVTQAPEIDGQGNDPVWTKAQVIQTLDFSSQRPIEITAVHDGVNVYMRVKYPDQAPSVTHKSWVWDAKNDFYKQGFDREDMFVIKWSMQGNDIDMALRHANPHTADIWFWKACRTNPMGYWDDKRHEMTAEHVQKSLEIKSANGSHAHLRRIGDKGKQAYSEVFPSEFNTQFVKRYVNEKPAGSRGDVSGKGVWKDGYWTIESKRLLQTGNEDDLQMQQGGQYLFGVACYEIAGTKIDLAYSQPLYRTGDVFDRIILVIE